jgi:hypothetical protein
MGPDDRSDNGSTDFDERRADAFASFLGEINQALGRDLADRKGYIAALASIAQFIRFVYGEESGVRLLRLAAALSDLDHGTVSPLLTPAPLNSRAMDSSETWAARTYAALALECLVRCRDPVDEAAQQLSRPHRYDWKTLKNWRRELKAGRVKNPLAQIMFSNGLARVKQFNDIELRAAAKEFTHLSRGAS